MIDQINPRARRDEFGSKINRDHSRLLAYGVPWLSILLFSLTLIAAELLDARFPWRSFWQDWIIASGTVAAYLAVAALFSGARVDMSQLTALLPQLLLSVLTFPIIARMVSLLDRLRLLRVRRLG